ncbi:MAG TPA: hypothetical protein VLW50_25025 [Streptosporangiaceae bacterium]|nr:hypothetical protein [Streptosporangiaceae bacterium]
MSDGLDAALLQLSQHGERIATLGAREAGHYQELGSKLTELGRTLSGVKGTVTDQGEILRGLAGIDEKVADLELLVDQLVPRGKPLPADYKPIPTIKWWQADDADRVQSIERLSVWAGKIFVPGYGHLSAMLPACWAQHELALYTMDWLSELWSVLYLTEERSARTVSDQAEFQTRILPAACQQLAREGVHCGHAARRR